MDNVQTYNVACQRFSELKRSGNDRCFPETIKMPSPNAQFWDIQDFRQHVLLQECERFWLRMLIKDDKPHKNGSQIENSANYTGLM